MNLSGEESEWRWIQMEIDLTGDESNWREIQVKSNPT